MPRCGHGDQLDRADRAAVELAIVAHHRPADPEIGPPVEQHRRHAAQRFDMQPQIDCRKSHGKVAQQRSQHGRRIHHVDHQGQFRLQSLVVIACLGEQVVDILGHRAGGRQQGAPRRGQFRTTRTLAIEQPHIEQQFKLGDAIADCRNRPAQPARRGVEAAFVGHGEEDAQLVECRLPQVHSIYPNI